MQQEHNRVWEATAQAGVSILQGWKSLRQQAWASLGESTEVFRSRHRLCLALCFGNKVLFSARSARFHFGMVFFFLFQSSFVQKGRAKPLGSHLARKRIGSSCRTYRPRSKHTIFTVSKRLRQSLRALGSWRVSVSGPKPAGGAGSAHSLFIPAWICLTAPDGNRC